MAPVPDGERGVGEHVSLHRLQPLGNGGRVGGELVDHGTKLRPGGVALGLGEHGPDQRRDHRPLTVRGGGEQIPHRMHAAALPPGSLEATPDRFDEPGMRIGDHQTHAGKAAIDQAGQELAPERLVLRVANVDAEYLAVPVSTQPGGDHDGFGDDVAVLADVDVGGVEPHVHERLMVEPSGA